MLPYLQYGIRTLFFLSFYLLILTGISVALLTFSLLLFLFEKNPFLRSKINTILNYIGYVWSRANHWVLTRATSIEWDIQGVENLNTTSSYLVIANHQSWIDIIIIAKIFPHIPLTRFFIKKSLLNVPIMGWAARALHFPAMQRNVKLSKSGAPKDLEITKKSCEKLKKISFSLVNFVEGTRFTKEKQIRSPYQYLLRPKINGLGIALYSLQNQINGILNTTILYYPGPINVWNFFMGKISKVIIRVEYLPIPIALLRDTSFNREMRQAIQEWINQIWQEKDKWIQETLNQIK